MTNPARLLAVTLLGALLLAVREAEAQRPDSVATSFVRRLNDSSSAVRDSAQAELLRRAPELLPRFESVLGSRDYSLSIGAARAIVLTGTAGLPVIRRYLADTGRTKFIMKEGLQWAPASDSAALVILTALFEDSSAVVRAAAVSAANPYREGSAALGRALLRLVDDPSPAVRAAVPYEMLQIRDTVLHAEFPARIVHLVSDSDPSVRRSAVYALGQMGRHAAVAVPAIAERLRSDSNVQVRWLSARALGWLGRTASPAVPVLLAHLDDPIDTVRVESLIALGSAELDGLRPSLADSVITALRSRLDSNDMEIRRLAIRSLARIGTPAVPSLIDALQSSHDSVAIIAAQGLAFQPDDERIHEPILRALADPRESVARTAAVALAGADTSIRTELQRVAREGSPGAREAAELAMRRLGTVTMFPVARRCYAVEYGEWTPPLASGTVEGTRPPRAIRFSSVGATPDMPDTALFVVEQRFENEWVPSGIWNVMPDERHIELDANPYLSGIRITLEVVSENLLRGTAEAYWDVVPHQIERAEVVLRRFPCDSMPSPPQR